jgi:hypothetical protein
MNLISFQIKNYKGEVEGQTFMFQLITNYVG